MANFWAHGRLSSLKLSCLALMSRISALQHLFFPVSRWATESRKDWQLGYGYILIRRIWYATNRLLSRGLLSSIPTLVICYHSWMLHRSRIVQNFVQSCYFCAGQIVEVFALTAHLEMASWSSRSHFGWWGLLWFIFNNQQFSMRWSQRLLLLLCYQFTTDLHIAWALRHPSCGIMNTTGLAQHRRKRASLAGIERSRLVTAPWLIAFHFWFCQNRRLTGGTCFSI